MWEICGPSRAGDIHEVLELLRKVGRQQGVGCSLTQQEDEKTQPDPTDSPMSPFINDRLVAVAAQKDSLASQPGQSHCPLLCCLFSKGTSWCPPSRLRGQTCVENLSMSLWAHLPWCHTVFQSWTGRRSPPAPSVPKAEHLWGKMPTPLHPGIIARAAHGGTSQDVWVSSGWVLCPFRG